MVNESDFSPEEWKQILNSPQMAALYVALASPSGLIGVMQEMMAATKGIVNAIQKSTGNSLIDAMAADYKEKADKWEKVEPPQMDKDLEKMKAQCLQFFRDLSALLSQKAPGEADGFKQWVYQTAKDSAEAAREGGFLGIGGVKVSEAEAAALKDIAGVLGITV